MSQSNRKRRQRIRNLRQSARIASAAVKHAFSELTPASQARVRQKGLTPSRVVVKTGTDTLARATAPAITFAAKESGKLAVKDIRGVARHEVSHFSLPGVPIKAGGRQHFSLRVAGARDVELLTVPSRAVLRGAEVAERLPTSRRIALATKHRLAQRRWAPSGLYK